MTSVFRERSDSTNKWVELSFCLPHKVHKRHLPNVLVEPESIFQCLEMLRPYHSILLKIEPQDLLEQLSTDASPALRRLIRQCSPLKSFRNLAVDCDLSLMQVSVVTLICKPDHMPSFHIHID